MPSGEGAGTSPSPEGKCTDRISALHLHPKLSSPPVKLRAVAVWQSAAPGLDGLSCTRQSSLFVEGICSSVSSNTCTGCCRSVGGRTLQDLIDFCLCAYKTIRATKEARLQGQVVQLPAGPLRGLPSFSRLWCRRATIGIRHTRITGPAMDLRKRQRNHTGSRFPSF